MRKRWWLAALVALVILAAALPAAAGVLTAGSYTYMLRGQELDLPVDILSVQGNYLVPQELLGALGLTPIVKEKSIHLERGPVAVELTLGGDTANVNGKTKLLKAAPMMVSGRLFLPAEVLPDLGLAMTVDGKFVFLKDYAPTEPSTETSQADYDKMLKEHTLQAFIRDGSTFATVTVTALTPDLLKDARLPIPWGTRLKLIDMLNSRTLLMVTMRNQSVKAVSLDPNKLMLVTDDGSQFDYLKEEVSVDGAVTAAVAPGAIRTSVVAYGKVDAAGFSLYHDGMGGILGRLPAR